MCKMLYCFTWVISQFFTQFYEKVINYYPLFTGGENKASGAGDSAHDGSSRSR